MILVNPYTGKTVDASERAAERLIRAGFRPVEIVPPPAKRGRPKKKSVE